MAQVGHATRADVDQLLERATAAWEGLAEVDQEIDGWDLIDQIVYIKEWQIEEDRLLRLAQHAESEEFTEMQRLRYQELLNLVERNRPVLARIMHG